MRSRYPVYVISKGRHDRCLTARMLERDGVEFHLVVEPQEAEMYASRHGRERLRPLPFSNLGLGSIPARNWVWEDAVAAGAERHWVLDDNIRNVFRAVDGRSRLRCPAGTAFALVEEFVDRYDNVALAGLNYQTFVTPKTRLPFYLNVHVYSCILARNDLPFRWRGRYNEDTDLCLQALSAGWCTVLVNVFCVGKMATMTMKGGNTDELYAGDGRLRMARALERQWPGVVTVRRRFGRPQHSVPWGVFKTPLKKKPAAPVPTQVADERGLVLRAVATVRSPDLRAWAARCGVEVDPE